MRTRSRWPAQFDIEGVERDTRVRQQLLDSQQQRQEQNAMKVSNISQPGKFDFNSPPKVVIPYQEYPRLLYKASASKQVHNDEERDAALKHGWQLKRTMPLKARGKTGVVAALPVPEDEEELEDLPLVEGEEDATSEDEEDSERGDIHVPVRARRKKKSA